MSLRQGQASGAFQRACDTAPVPQAGKNLQGFTACGVCRLMISLLAIDVGQIRQ